MKIRFNSFPFVTISVYKKAAVRRRMIYANFIPSSVMLITRAL